MKIDHLECAVLGTSDQDAPDTVQSDDVLAVTTVLMQEPSLLTCRPPTYVLISKNIDFNLHSANFVNKTTLYVQVSTQVQNRLMQGDTQRPLARQSSWIYLLIQSHVGIAGNNKADELAKNGADMH